jgi:hypothetical protein
VRREVGARGYTSHLQRGGECDGRRALAVGADNLRDPHGTLRVSEELEEGLDALQAQGDVAATVEFVADVGEGVRRGE